MDPEPEDPRYEQRSLARVVPPVQPRKLAKVPFVELADGRLHGVVSSGSDPARVYVSWIAAGDLSIHCSTNNNRPCGGLRGRACNHIWTLAEEAVLQYGLARVTRYLRVEAADGAEMSTILGGQHVPGPASEVFSAFLRHLSQLELPTTTEPIPELAWFPAGGGAS